MHTAHEVPQGIFLSNGEGLITDTGWAYSAAIISGRNELEIRDGVLVDGSQCEKTEGELRKGLVTGRGERSLT